MSRTKQARKKTVFSRILLPMILVVAVQLCIYLATLSAGGIFNSVQSDTLYNFSEKVKNRSQYLVTDMVNRWSNVDATRTSILQNVENYLTSNGYSYSDIKSDAALNEQLIELVSDTILKLMRNNGTTGAFIVLDGIGTSTDPLSYAGMYLRDHDPSHQSMDNSDVLLERGFPGLSRKMNIPLDSYWSAAYNFDDQKADNSQFFFKPLNAAKDSSTPEKNQKFDYWSHSFRLSDVSDTEIITYSIPLISDSGEIYGVMGIELALDFLAKLLPYSEVGNGGNGIYVLGVTSDNGKTISSVVNSGPSYVRAVGNSDLIVTSKTDYLDITSIESPDGELFFASQQMLRLYNSNTIFSDENWVLMGLSSERDMFSFLTLFRNQLILATLFSLAIGVIVSFIVSRETTKPVIKLVSELKSSNPNGHISLSKTNVAEVDALSEAIEDLSLLVAQSAARISKIIELSGYPIGVFEYSSDDGLIFCSKTLLKIMGRQDPIDEDKYLLREDFAVMMKPLKDCVYDLDAKIYKLGEDKYLQLKIYTESKKTVGTLVDITRDMQEKQQIEYERDYDVLTDLYNRRAFRGRMEKLFRSDCIAELKISAMVMLDLDNLKYTNDQFGHDVGDKYIQALARKLKQLISKNIVVARRSGDEFHIFLYGYDSKVDIWNKLIAFWDDLKNENITLPNGQLLKVRVSGGVAWYPDNANSFVELLRLSDFAMYTAKNSLKGSLQQFSPESYRNDEVIYSGQEALNQLIEQELVRYAMQPIVSVKDGSIYGYEMLMRPQSEHLTNVSEVLRVAKANSKSSQIERLTWYLSLKTFSEQVAANNVSADCKVFINSIPNHIMTDGSLIELKEKYGQMLSRVVLEITEDEKDNQNYTTAKQAIIKQWGALLAIDDFGSGYNGENMLINIFPDIIKTDMGLVRDIDKDENRQILMRNIIAYAKERNVKILAEGVETVEEMRLLVQMKVDYIQGYYFAKPSFEVQTIPKHLIDAMLEAKENAENMQLRRRASDRLTD